MRVQILLCVRNLSELCPGWTWTLPVTHIRHTEQSLVLWLSFQNFFFYRNLHIYLQIRIKVNTLFLYCSTEVRNKRKHNHSKATQVGGTWGPHQHHGKWWGLLSGCLWCWGHWAPRLCTLNVQATTGTEKLTPKCATKAVRLPLSSVPHALGPSQG